MRRLTTGLSIPSRIQDESYSAGRENQKGNFQFLLGFKQARHTTAKTWWTTDFQFLLGFKPPCMCYYSYHIVNASSPTFQFLLGFKLFALSGCGPADGFQFLLGFKLERSQQATPDSSETFNSFSDSRVIVKLDYHQAGRTLSIPSRIQAIWCSVLWCCRVLYLSIPSRIQAATGSAFGCGTCFQFLLGFKGGT